MRTKVLVALTLALLTGCWLVSGQTFIGRPLKPLNAGFTPDVAEFDGTSDTLSRSDMATIADSKTVTISVWFKSDADGAMQILDYISGPAFLSMGRTGGNLIAISGKTVFGSATVVTGTSSQQVTTAMGWTHIYICFNLANPTQRHFYIDGVEDAGVVWSVYDNTAMSLALGGTWSISVSGSRIDGGLSELWFDDTFLNDPSKFIAGGCPVDLGSNGETPSGSPPALYLSRNGGGDDWRIDSSGNGNNFTVTGALGTIAGPCP